VIILSVILDGLPESETSVMPLKLFELLRARVYKRICMKRHVALIPFLTAIACFPVEAEISVTPPKVPQMSKQYIPEDELKALKQSPALAAELESLGQGSIEERVARLKKKVVNDLIFVEGGTFMMGDFGPLWSPEKLPYSDQLSSRPAHEVTLSSFSTAKYKTTFAEFDVYTDATATERGGLEGISSRKLRHPTIPAGVRWQRAKDYCLWLAQITQLPFDLPTEAQWEFAARSRGQFFVWATDNGSIDYGRNVPAAGQMALISPTKRSSGPYSVGLFPPNPLGLFDASHNGEEWVNDWYDEQYYKNSPKKDPKGPATGTLKVARGWPNGDSIMPNTMYRHKRQLIEPSYYVQNVGTLPGIYTSSGFRCSLQQPERFP
jgi:sulfatase modifying factor 1